MHRIAKLIGNKTLEGKAYSNLGNAHSFLGDFTKAIEYHKQGRRIANQVGNKNLEGNSYICLGNAYHSLGEMEEADQSFQEALDISKQVGNKRSEARALNGLGLVRYHLFQYKEAIEFFQKSLSISKAIGEKDWEVDAHANLGAVYGSLGDLKTAIKFFQQARDIAKELGNKLTEATASADLGLAYCTLQDVSLGEDILKASVELFDEMRALLKSNDQWKISLRNRYDDVYRSLVLAQLKQNKFEEALSSAERGRAQALKSAQPDSDEHICWVSKYFTSTTVFLGQGSNSVNFWVLQEGEPCQFVQKKINGGIKSLTDKAHKNIRGREVKCEDRSLDQPADEEPKVVSERNLAEKEQSLEGEGDALKVLFDLLIVPISHLIQGDEVIIVPDAALFLVPYAALVDQHSSYLSETLRIRLVPILTSLKLMAECPEKYHSTSGALLVGDPWVESVRIKTTEGKYKQLLQLPAVKLEVETIGTILNVAPLTGKNATKAEVLSRLNSVALIHIAAHGRAETGEIVLSPNPSTSRRPKEEDFLLTMADVLSKKLQAKLVVLSCCHSGRGEIKAEGVVGLARAVLGAGARSVLASLWAIDDEGTLQFMRCFYEHLVKGESAGIALNQAMRESDDFNDVKFWAPFVLIGDDVTLKFDELR